jgi:hypothetical protein
MTLVELPVSVPPFFVEACGYRGSARYVALHWHEEPGELMLSDDGHAVSGQAQPMVTLWRGDGGTGALDRFRAWRDELGRPPWLLVDRDRRMLFLGCAPDIWSVVEGQARNRR